MIKLLDEEKSHVIVKMDRNTYHKILLIDTSSKKIKPESEINELIEDARNSKAYNTVDELFDDLNN